MKTLTFMSSGKLGDTIASLASVKEVCLKENAKAHIVLDTTGGMTVGDDETKDIVRKQTGGKGVPFSRAACEYLKPLLEHQDYIDKVDIYDGTQPEPEVDINLNKMRGVFLDLEAVKATGQNLELAYKYALGLPLTTTSSWLAAPKVEPFKDICICRSTRYTSAHLWLAMHENMLKDAFFLGTDFEHIVFKDAFGFAPTYLKTANALEAASLIQSSKLFIGNGSLMYWISVGLGHP